MAWPLFLLGAGTAASIASPILQARAMNAAISKALRQQSQFAAKAQRRLDPAIAGSTMEAANKQLKAGETKALEGYRQVADVPTTVKPDTGTNVHQVNPAWSYLMGAMRAPQEGYNEFTLRQAIKNLRSAQDIQQIGSIARGYGQAAGPNIQSAGSKYQWLDILGQLMQAGGVAGAGGLFGGGAKPTGGHSYKFIDEFLGQ